MERLVLKYVSSGQFWFLKTPFYHWRFFPGTATQKLPPKLEPQPEHEIPQLEVVQSKDVTDHVQIEQKSSTSTTTSSTVESSSKQVKGKSIVE